MGASGEGLDRQMVGGASGTETTFWAKAQGVRAYGIFQEPQRTARESCWTMGVHRWGGMGVVGLGGVPLSVLGEVGAVEGFKQREVFHQAIVRGYSGG